MSTTSDFKAQPFSGIGDSRTVEFRRFIENQIQQHQFAPFAAQGYMLPDIAADLKLMQQLGNRARQAYVYSQSAAAEGHRALTATIAANGVVTAAEQMQLDALAPLRLWEPHALGSGGRAGGACVRDAVWNSPG